MSLSDALKLVICLLPLATACAQPVAEEEADTASGAASEGKAPTRETKKPPAAAGTGRTAGRPVTYTDNSDAPDSLLRALKGASFTFAAGTGEPFKIAADGKSAVVTVNDPIYQVMTFSTPKVYCKTTGSGFETKAMPTCAENEVSAIAYKATITTAIDGEITCLLFVKPSGESAQLHVNPSETYGNSLQLELRRR